jgi:hypothetical protein
MIAQDLQPLSIVEDEGFRHFVAVLDPCFKMPARKTVRELHIPKLFHEVKALVIKDLEQSKAVALTTDLWTSSANTSYMAVTAHFWNDDTSTFLSRVLDCSRFEGSHTSLAILRTLTDTTETFKITEKVSNITADGAANVKKAVLDGGFNYLHCFGHAIDLVVKDATR